MALKSLHLEIAVSNRNYCNWLKPHNVCEIILLKTMLFCITKNLNSLLFLRVDFFILKWLLKMKYNGSCCALLCTSTYPIMFPLNPSLTFFGVPKYLVIAFSKGQIISKWFLWPRKFSKIWPEKYVGII